MMSDDLQSLYFDLEPLEAASEAPGHPFLEIRAEPQEFHRFRYGREENGSHGVIRASSDSREYPTVALRSFSGSKAYISCTLWQVKENSFPHSHKLVTSSRECSGLQLKQDPFLKEVSAEEDFEVSFEKMRVIHTKKKDIVRELTQKLSRMRKLESDQELSQAEADAVRKFVEVEAKTMDLNKVCLCFEAFVRQGNVLQRLCSVVSRPIKNSHSAKTGELEIRQMSAIVGEARGGQVIFLLVKKLSKDKIKVRFFRESTSDIDEPWEKTVEDIFVHYQTAIVLKAPPYRDPLIDQPVEVFIELYREMNQEEKDQSEPWKFTYMPSENPNPRKRFRGMLEEILTTDLGHSEEKQVERIREELLRDLPEEDGASTSGTAKFEDGSQSFQKRCALLYFKLMILMLHNYGQQGAFEKEWGKMAKIFYHANKKGENFFFSAIEQGNVLVFKKVVQVLQSYRLEDLLTLSNDQNETCLHIACSFNRVSYLRLLLELGADPNHVDHKGNAPLHVCVLEGKLECLDKLLEASKSSHGTLRLDIENFDGLTALHLAVKLSQVPFIKRLLEAGASPSTTDAKTGDTILHTAVEQRSFETVRFVVESCGAADLLNATNHADHSPIQTVAAEESDDADLRIAKYLLQRGAKCTKIEMEVLERIKHVSDEEPVFKVPEVPKPEVPLPGPSFVIPQAPFEELQEVAEPIKLDEIARDELFSILGADQNWKKLAKLLGFEKLLEIWQLSKNPVKSLIDYIEEKRVVDSVRLCSYLRLLDIEAIEVVSFLMARNLQD